MSAKNKPRWHKTDERSHYVLTTAGGDVLAHVFLGGAYGRDDYPWDYYLERGVESVVTFASGRQPRTTGSVETKREAVEIVEWLLGLSKPVSVA